MVSREHRESLRVLEEAVKRKARNDFLSYAKYVFSGFDCTDFHRTYYRILGLFAEGVIKKLIISTQPQIGKSTGSSILLPSYLLGIDSDLKIAIVSYSATRARKFGRKCRNIMIDGSYQELFGARMAGKRDTMNINTSEEMEIVGGDGVLKLVGYEGGLTGDPVDVLIMDDLYKDLKEANSPVIRDNVIDWYGGVADTRIHNDTRQLIVFTRWHEDDLIGYLEKNAEVIEPKTWDELMNCGDSWVKINFEAIKSGEPTEIDPRAVGEVLYPDRHSLERLLQSRKLMGDVFEKLYQGNPADKRSLLYGDFRRYVRTSDYGLVVGKGNYTDVADEGKDYLCSVCYDKVKGKDEMGNPMFFLCVTDVLYTQDPAEITVRKTIELINRSQTRYVMIESNSGGRGFALMVRPHVRARVGWFFQNKNKESRIMTTAPLVTTHVVLPDDYQTRWPQFAEALDKFKADFSANRNDDAPDVLTGIVEREILYSRNHVGVKRRN